MTLRHVFVKETLVYVHDPALHDGPKQQDQLNDNAARLNFNAESFWWWQNVCIACGFLSYSLPPGISVHAST